MQKIILICTVSIFLTQCNRQSKIDASSEDAFKKSVEKMAKELNEDERKEFREALMKSVMSSISLEKAMTGNVDEKPLDVYRKLDGKTAQEIVKDRKKREKEQALKEIQDLEKKQLKAEKSKKELEKIKVIKSRFYKEKQGFMGLRPVISLEIKNESNNSLSRVYFKGTLASPGRKVPWLVEEFNYEISGGIEPGETQKFSLAPNPYTEWGQVEIKKDAIFTVEVVRVDDHNNKELYSVDFNEKDAKRLAEIKSKYE